MNIYTLELINKSSANRKKLNLFDKQINGHIDLKKFSLIKKFICNDNKITEIINFSNNLLMINCSNNLITKLDNLPELLVELNCSQNKINELTNLLRCTPRFNNLLVV